MPFQSWLCSILTTSHSLPSRILKGFKKSHFLRTAASASLLLLGHIVQVKGELTMACCWRVTPLDSVAIKARSLAAEVAQREDLLAMLAEQTLDCSGGLSPLRGSSSTASMQSLMACKGLLRVKVCAHVLSDAHQVFAEIEHAIVTASGCLTKIHARILVTAMEHIYWSKTPT